MAKTSKLYRFRANPVEVLIFLAVTGVFARSVYQLVYDPEVLTAMTVSTPAAVSGQSRSPASISQTFLNMELSCDKNADHDTGATKVRLTGNLCGVDSTTDATKLVRTVISNEANKFAATVFTDVRGGKFSTDYIPLNSGKNPIHVEFSYRDGKVVTQDVVILKN
ncbi:MAG: hypothetical protein A2X94_07025 [Bdellovibrionales bacterium GWB1_55_8]|nr:MAG: hypothetical protein A2X94_07025 [Bdellovibrionales bacterium GWB1_55_8]